MPTRTLQPKTTKDVYRSGFPGYNLTKRGGLPYPPPLPKLHFTMKTKNWATRIPLNIGGERMCSWGISSSCSTCSTCRVTLVTNPVISHQCGNNHYFCISDRTGNSRARFRNPIFHFPNIRWAVICFMPSQTPDSFRIRYRTWFIRWIQSLPPAWPKCSWFRRD